MTRAASVILTLLLSCFTGAWLAIVAMISLGLPAYLAAVALLLGAAIGFITSPPLIAARLLGVRRSAIAGVLVLTSIATAVSGALCRANDNGLLTCLLISLVFYVTLSIGAAAWVVLNPPACTDGSKCRTCGYSREGLATPRCPECGDTVSRESRTCGQTPCTRHCRAVRRFSARWL